MNHVNKLNHDHFNLSERVSGPDNAAWRGWGGHNAIGDDAGTSEIHGDGAHRRDWPGYPGQINVKWRMVMKWSTTAFLPVCLLLSSMSMAAHAAPISITVRNCLQGSNWRFMTFNQKDKARMIPFQDGHVAFDHSITLKCKGPDNCVLRTFFPLGSSELRIKKNSIVVFYKSRLWDSPSAVYYNKNTCRGFMNGTAPSAFLEEPKLAK